MTLEKPNKETPEEQNKEKKYYIFKYTKEDREHQLWSELIASYIAGDLLGWKVQVTKIARRQGRLGNLLEYIHTHPEQKPNYQTLIEGAQLCKQIDNDFDLKKGTRHTLSLLMRVCNELLIPVYNLPKEEFFDFWAKTLAFDTLISNGDRHAGNWAIIKGQQGTRMAPLYDNGSSLGCEVGDVKLAKVFDQSGTIQASHLEKRRKQGRYRLRLQSQSKRDPTFEEVCLAFLDIHPGGRHRFEAAERVDIRAVCRLLESISAQSGVEKRYFLSYRRIRHICAILQIGLERIRNVLLKSDKP